MLLINPNTSAAVTDGMVGSLRTQLGPHAAVQGVTAAFGAPVIATAAAFAVAADAALDAWARRPTGAYDAVVLGCFGDPGLARLRRVAAVPVIGLADAAFDAAAQAGEPFAVVTLGPAWGPILRAQLAVYAAGALCRGVHALKGSGADMLRDPAATLHAIDRACRALPPDVAAVVLGGAVLAGIGPRLSAPVRFIDPLDCAAAAVLARTPPLLPGAG